MPKRLQALRSWLNDQSTMSSFELAPLKNDASFRRYFRITQDNKTFIAMDAPPLQENNHAFVAIANRFIQEGLFAPEIIASDFDQGFLLLSDLGDKLYLDELTHKNADALYTKAIHALTSLQTCTDFQNYTLPTFDHEFMLRELKLFDEWFCQKHLGLEFELPQSFSNVLIESALSQPQVCIHRDYHSRNLMILPNNNVGIIDFQDACIGPITYDLVSLLKDCYIDWPQQKIEDWLAKSDILKPYSKEEALRWFDLMGLQRHLKVLGIFARLNIRDNKPQYLQYFPRIFNYVLDVTKKYSELSDFHHFFQEKINQ